MLLRSLALCASTTTLLACSQTAKVEPLPDGGVDAALTWNDVPEWDKPITAPSDDAANTNRASCTYAQGALPAETQGASHPTGKSLPIDTIVIVMMENRSFDHYFQKGKEAGLDVDVAPADFSNLGTGGTPVTIHRDNRLCLVDTAHGWTDVHDQVGKDSKMDGFFRTNDGHHELPAGGKDKPELLSGDRSLTYYEKADLPFMYWAAEQFSLGDRYFSSLLGPTWPNRMYLYGASSFGSVGNSFPATVGTTIFELLEKRGVSWGIYASTTPGASVFIDRVIKYREHITSEANFYEAAKSGTLPQVVFLDPQIASEGFSKTDEHPPAIMQIGQKWLAGVTKAMIASPQWSRSAMFITYDEHGGFYDHVVPPKACVPDTIALEAPATPEQKFDQYGIRVPFVVISPYAKKKFVSHRVYDHTSILRFVESRFTLPALSGRDANAEGPWDVFDFAAPPNLSPSSPPDVAVDDKTFSECSTIFR